MYATLSLASYWQSVAATKKGNGAGEENHLFPPPEGPNSAYLIFQEDEDEHMDQGQNTFLRGCCDQNRVRELPFPQDKCLTVEYAATAIIGPDEMPGTYIERDRVYFIPVLGQPISSHCYYVVRAEGKHKGLVETCCREDELPDLCRRRNASDILPRHLESNNPYQRIQVVPRKSRFTSRCLAPDGAPPCFLRRKDWRVRAKELRGKHGRLAHVHGENAYLRSRLPSLNFLVGKASPIVTVGEWYCPFIFIEELGSFRDRKDQLMESPFYKMCLEKFWEEIYGVERSGGGDVAVEKTVRSEEVLLFGKEATEMITVDDGVMWTAGLEKAEAGVKGVILSRPIVEKIRADQGRLEGETGGTDVKLKRSFGGIEVGKKFACYVEVERYVLKRMDGGVVMTYSFRNCNHVEGKWE